MSVTPKFKIGEMVVLLGTKRETRSVRNSEWQQFKDISKRDKGSIGEIVGTLNDDIYSFNRLIYVVDFTKKDNASPSNGWHFWAEDLKNTEPNRLEVLNLKLGAK